MGLTNIHAVISNIDNKKLKAEAIFLVDTGAGYTVLPYLIAKKIKVKPVKKQIFSLADGSTVTRDIGYAMVEIKDNIAPSPVVIGKKGDSALLGAVTLENMGLMVDPFRRELKPMKLMLG